MVVATATSSLKNKNKETHEEQRNTLYSERAAGLLVCRIQCTDLFWNTVSYMFVPFVAMVITNVFSDSISHLNMFVNLETLQCVASSMRNKMIKIVNGL